MLPINDEHRKLIIAALKNEADLLTIEMSIPQSGKGLMTDDEYTALIAEYEALHDRLLSGDWVVFETKPQCMVTIKDQGRCDQPGRFAPFIVVYGSDGKTPVCQAETSPPLRVCEAHATNNVDHYLPPENWKDISAQAVRATGQIVQREHARVMFLDIETGQLVPPPTVHIVGT